MGKVRGRVRFDVFEADFDTGELRKHGLKRRLEEKPFQILVLLLERAGKLVTREELCEKLWPSGVNVSFEHSLNSAVNRLRESLGDSARAPRFIETLPRRGYRLLVPVEPVAETSVGHERFLLAVLPFANLSDDPGQEYFSDGLTEELLTHLARLNPKRMGVIARTSVMQYKNTQKSIQEIATELNVDYLLQGSVRRAANRVRIHAQLIEAEGQSHLWADGYDRELTDVFAIQQDVAEAVARALRWELFPDPGVAVSVRTSSVVVEAYESFLMGRHHCNKRTPECLSQAIEYFQEAVKREPGFAAAYQGLADSYNQSVEYGLYAPRHAYPHAEKVARRAIDLDPALGSALAALAAVQHRFKWDWAGAESSFRSAIELGPGEATSHHLYAEFLSQMGRHEEALEEIRQAAMLDPLSCIISAVEAWLLYHARRYEEAVSRSRAILDLYADFPIALYVLGRAHLQLGQLQDALSACQRAARSSGRNPFILAGLGYVSALSAEKQRGREILAELEKDSQASYVSPWLQAKVLIGLEEKDRALDLLEQAWLERSGWLVDLKVDPEVDILRGEPRFQELYRRMKFPNAETPPTL